MVGARLGGIVFGGLWVESASLSFVDVNGEESVGVDGVEGFGGFEGGLEGEREPEGFRFARQRPYGRPIVTIEELPDISTKGS